MGPALILALTLLPLLGKTPQAVPAALAQPVINATPLDTNYCFKITWQPVPGAYRYLIERSTDGPSGPWEMLIGPKLTEMDCPWVDKSSGRYNPPFNTDGNPFAHIGLHLLGIWYRMLVYDKDGRPGRYSEALQAKKPEQIPGLMQNFMLRH